MASSSREWTPSGPTRSMSACRTSTVARASDSARWLGVVGGPEVAGEGAELAVAHLVAQQDGAGEPSGVDDGRARARPRPSRAQAPLRKDTS